MADPLLLDVFSPEDVQQIFSMPPEAGAEFALGKIGQAVQGKPQDQVNSIRAQVETVLRLDFPFLVIMIQTYRRFPSWVPVINWISQHQAEFEAFQAALGDFLDGEEPNDDEDEDEPSPIGTGGLQGAKP